MVDWEEVGKIERQIGKGLETTCDTIEDLRTLSSNLKIPVSVRINALGDQTQSEVDTALNNGAKNIMLPMANTIKEVKEFLKIMDKRAKTIIQIETPSLVKELDDFKDLDWDYAYIGLNDLMVASGRHNIWEAIADGTTDEICSHLRGRKYGFGGTTIIGGGDPICGALILHEQVRLGVSMSLMRRTFKSELLDRDLITEMQLLRAFVQCSKKRGPNAMESDRQRLLKVIQQLAK